MLVTIKALVVCSPLIYLNFIPKPPFVIRYSFTHHVSFMVCITGVQQISWSFDSFPILLSLLASLVKSKRENSPAIESAPF